MACWEAADWARMLKLVRPEALHSLLPSSLRLSLLLRRSLYFFYERLHVSKSVSMSMSTRASFQATIGSLRFSSLCMLTPVILEQQHQITPVRLHEPGPPAVCICTAAPGSLSEVRHAKSVNLLHLFWPLTTQTSLRRELNSSPLPYLDLQRACPSTPSALGLLPWFCL